MSKSKNQTITTSDVANLNEVLNAPTEKKQIGYNYAELLETHKTKSAMIRFLASESFERGVIAKFMGIKYQFVRNVLVQPVKKAS